MKGLSLLKDRRFLAGLLLLPLLLWTRPAGAAIPLDRKTMMPLSEVRPGMRGIGRTVFSGVKIETFGVRVIGVLPKENLGGALILVRMDGGPITGRQANIIGGMSGSPVYINGRLVGAVAYGQTFPREPIAMLTPIEDMLEALDPALPQQLSRAEKKQAQASLSRRLPQPVNISGKVYNQIDIRHASSGTAAGRDGVLEMAPLATPVSVSGISERGMKQLSGVLSQFNAEPMAGPGGISYPKPITLEPGSSVGASLITGDVDMTAVGTVTYRKGNQILAFGHPFLQMGAVDLPLTTAWVHDVF
ncbi:MAG TPA: SpoIVB peptidase S55 domain-containing protein, partial [Armatimonadota bacterium]|nr:SpoIVB peptidase S55 domain-containing protein [Armatimonadota bacterium]